MGKHASESPCPSVWYAGVKIVMFTLWCLLTGLDIWMLHWNGAPPWAVGFLVLTNGWGWLDAVLRYPLLHDIDSFFTLKNMLLILLKILWLILVFMRSKTNPVSFVICAMLAIIAPMFYAMMLPLDEPDQVYNLIKSLYIDEDIALRFWNFVRAPGHGFQAWNRQRNKIIKRGLEEIAELSPRAAAKLGEMSPSRRAMLRKPGRSV
mmetsp:Transcript_2997/g.5236  ORF Transcript_2997/g.5236 Transcript_2997/m.5236 type:complete len:206 (-) Transcript_2997:25-642(-)